MPAGGGRRLLLATATRKNIDSISTCYSALYTVSTTHAGVGPVRQ